MPASKIRGGSVNAHYSVHKDVVFGKRKKMLYGNKPVPVPEKRSPYLGSVITPQTRREYELKQQEHFKIRYTADVVSRRNNILAQDKPQEEIEQEVMDFNLKQPDEDQLQEMSERFARNQSNKEQKHYRAWLRYDEYYKFMDQRYPVMTEKFINKSKENVEIEQLVKAKLAEVKQEEGESDTSNNGE